MDAAQHHGDASTPAGRYLKEVPDGGGEHRWVFTLVNADVVTRAESPGWFHTYVGEELLLGAVLAASALVPVRHKIQRV